jgi:hypothetical protein
MMAMSAEVVSTRIAHAVGDVIRAADHDWATNDADRMGARFTRQHQAEDARRQTEEDSRHEISLHIL